MSLFVVTPIFSGSTCSTKSRRNTLGTTCVASFWLGSCLRVSRLSNLSLCNPFPSAHSELIKTDNQEVFLFCPMDFGYNSRILPPFLQSSPFDIGLHFSLTLLPIGGVSRCTASRVIIALGRDAPYTKFFYLYAYLVDSSLPAVSLDDWRKRTDLSKDRDIVVLPETFLPNIVTFIRIPELSYSIRMALYFWSSWS